MKVAYCRLGCGSFGVITFTDELLARIEELKVLVQQSTQSLKTDAPWTERLSTTILYGGMNSKPGKDSALRQEVTADGPVLAYAHHSYDKHRCVDDYVRINVRPNDAFVQSDHEEGTRNPLGYVWRNEHGYMDDCTIGTIQDVHFSTEFLRIWCENLMKIYTSPKDGIKQVVEDMPPEHRALLDEAAREYMANEVTGGCLKQTKEVERGIMRAHLEHFISASQFKQPDNMFRLGLDIHGVIDDDPVFFAMISKKIVSMGGCVHIITGTPLGENLYDLLKKHDITYTNVFSIVSHHKIAGTKMWQDEKGTWWMDPETWDRTKADYCRMWGINLHIDDSDTYGRYFDESTVYIKYPEMQTFKEYAKQG